MTAKLHNPDSTRPRYLIAGVDQVDSPIEQGLRRLHWRGRTGDTLSCVWEALLPLQRDAEGPDVSMSSADGGFAHGRC